MIIGIGADIVKIARIEAGWRKFGDKFLDKILTSREYPAKALTAEFVAGRWAAKEAAAKALGTGFRCGLSMLDIEISPDPLGLPILTFLRSAYMRMRILNISNCHLSITHEKEFAHAFVILER